MNNDFVVIELDKPRMLKFNIKALKKLEVTFGCKISKIGNVLSDMSIADLLKVVQAGLLHEEDLTLDVVEDLLDKYTTVAILIEKITEAFNIAFGGTKNEQRTVKEVTVNGI